MAEEAAPKPILPQTEAQLRSRPRGRRGGRGRSQRGGGRRSERPLRPEQQPGESSAVVQQAQPRESESIVRPAHAPRSFGSPLGKSIEQVTEVIEIGRA